MDTSNEHENQLREFSLKRDRFYQQFPHFWPNIYDSEYALYDIYHSSQEEIADIRQATLEVGRIYYQTAHLLRYATDDFLLSLGIPKETLKIIRLKPLTPESVITRMDFVRSTEGFKLLEVNSDTPTFIMECFQVNGKVAQEFGLKDPNHGTADLLKKSIHKAIEESLQWLQHTSSPHIVFTAHDDHVEDWNTTHFLKNFTGYSTRTVPLRQLKIDENGLYDELGNKIDILYRQTYPLEQLIHDQDEDGTKVGLMLLDLVKQKKLAMINPPSAFLNQSKAVQAAIWSLYEQNIFFSEQERLWINKYLLPTYLEPDYFIENKLKYIRKPAFGREGDTVQIIESSGEVFLESESKTYQDELPIYQQFVQLPQTEVMTTNGPKTVHYIFGSFLIAGKPSAIGVRAGKQITGNESYFLPVGIK